MIFTKSMSNKIEWDCPDFTESDINYAIKSLNSYIGAKGPNVELLENSFAKKVGATHTINSKTDNPIEACLEITDGRGVDCAIESAGHNETIRQTLECSRPGARIVILGKTPYGVEINLPFYTLMGEREIIRTSYGKSHPRIDFPRLANLYMDGKLYLDEMITKTYKLEEINEGFDALERGELARGLVIF